MEHKIDRRHLPEYIILTFALWGIMAGFTYLLWEGVRWIVRMVS